MSQDRLGMAYWMELSEEEQQKFIDMEIWKQEVFDKFVQEEEAKWERQASSKKGKSKKGSKHLRRRGRREEEEEYDDDYVE